MDIQSYLDKIDSSVNSYLDSLSSRLLNLVIKNLDKRTPINKTLLKTKPVPRSQATFKFAFLESDVKTYSSSLTKDIVSIVRKQLEEMERVYGISIGKVEFYKDLKNAVYAYMGQIPDTIYGDVIQAAAETMVTESKEVVVERLSKKINKSLNQTRRYLSEAITTYNRNRINTIYERIEVEGDLYVYDGPLDKKTSAFCREHVGKKRTRAEWLRIKENIFIEGGHPYCRHGFRLALRSDK